MKFANVIVDRKIKELDRYLQYIIPENLTDKVHIGSVVYVPLGRANTITPAFVVEISDVPEFDVNRTKEIIKIDETRIDIDSEMLVIAHWMHLRYGVTTQKALQVVTPVKAKVSHKEQVFYTKGDDKELFLQCLYEARRKKNMQARLRFLEAIKEEGSIEHSIAIDKLNITLAVIKPLLERGIIKKETTTVYRNMNFSDVSVSLEQTVLNEEQLNAVSKILAEYNGGEKRPCLLRGITGSGKTEVYMELISHVIKEGKQAILLIPEIALTYQTVMRFYKRFGDRVAVMNSRMSNGERYDQYLRAKNGEVDVVIGPRSALFAPLQNLGIIIIDEEHEDSYKSDHNPKYDAHEVSIYRGKLHDAMVVFGSATPSIETYYRAQNGMYAYASINHRAVPKSRPARTHIVDMRQEMQQGNSSIISRRLYDLILDRLSKNEQIMLFLNRRGYSNYLQCYNCGEVIKCKRCDISMTYHQDNILRCHYCGNSFMATNVCNKCGSVGKLTPMGIGTQKAAALIEALFPQARVLRMDQDTTSHKDGHQKILEAFSNHEADILVGTQMIVKGHDYANVTLVGILLADRSLNMATYKASEKTFQLLTQAAGRAGRGEREGDVIIQTYKPEHFAIKAAADQDYLSFYEQEIAIRKMLNYPPTLHLMTMLFQSENEDMALKKANEAILYIANHTKTDMLYVYGPTEDTVPKINYVFRKVVYVKSASKALLEQVRDEITNLVSGLKTQMISEKFTKNTTTSKYFTNTQNDVILEVGIDI